MLERGELILEALTPRKMLTKHTSLQSGSITKHAQYEMLTQHRPLSVMVKRHPADKATHRDAWENRAAIDPYRPVEQQGSSSGS